VITFKKNFLISLIILTSLLISTALSGFAFSSGEALSVISTENGYLSSGEAAQLFPGVSVTTTTQDFWVIAITKDSSLVGMIPFSSADGKVATGAVTIENIIKTALVAGNMSTLKTKTPVGGWILSITQKSNFYELELRLSSKTLDVVSARTELAKKGDVTKSIQTKLSEIETAYTNLSKESKTLAGIIEKGITTETNFLSKPTYETIQTYKTTYTNLFTEIDKYKGLYDTLSQKIDDAGRLIATSTAIERTEKQSYTGLIALPDKAQQLSLFFGQTNQVRTLVEDALASELTASDLASGLEIRVQRNNAWTKLYQTNETLKKLDASFETLKKAADSILSKENIDKWADQNSINYLKTNISSAESKYKLTEYVKSIEFATKAEKNIKDIMTKGVKEETKIGIKDSDLITIIGLLIMIVVGLFIFEKYKKTKKAKEENELGE
jgi:hypothetical protein